VFKYFSKNFGYTDVFTTGFTFPKRVCVLAPGPNGIPYYEKIPEDLYVIAVSKAITIKQVEINCWMMQGNNHSHYLQSEQRFEGVRMFRKDFIDSRQALSSSDSFERYSFQVKRPSPSQVIDFSSLAISQNKLIGGSTISGNAVQLAHLCGAREILLCGVDMSGDHYFDGSHNVCLTHGETWTFTPTFNRLIHWLHQNTDTTVSSLSPTKLTVPRFAH
jgi:hypothetical protein